MITTGSARPAYIRGLQDDCERQRLERSQRKDADLKAAAERLTPLEVRLAKLLATIPIEFQRKGLSLSSLQASLKGRKRGNCHPGELGAALRKLGFIRKRNWRGKDAFEAAWSRQQGG